MNPKHKPILISLITIIAGMFMLAYAAVPLYQVFCQITGYGGTTKAATSPPSQILDKDITISFNADISPDLKWKFKPNQKKVKIKIGEEKIITYTAENLTGENLKGISTFNVTPAIAGSYFNKIECFCFEEQTLAPHQKVEMPVLFFIDPAIINDRQLRDLKTITLSYTFFPIKNEG